MIKDQIIEKKMQELKRLKKFREHIPILKVNVGLPDEYVNEVLSKVDLKILNCEIAINENRQKMVCNHKIESSVGTKTRSC
jgi:hypothetical protein